MMHSGATPQGTQQGASSKVAASLQNKAKLDHIIALMNDDATSDQYERQYLELQAALVPFKNGFSPAVALNGFPQVLSFLHQTLSDPAGQELNEEDVEYLTNSLSILLQHAAYPIVCTTLEDQRKHDPALQQLLESVSLVLTLPQRALRIGAVIVLRQIFAFIRQQCSDDMTTQRVAYHKKKEFHRSISLVVVQRLLAAWKEVLEMNELEPSAAESEASDSDDDAAEAKPEKEARNCGPELVATVKAVVELSYYRTICGQLLDNGVNNILFKTMAKCAPGERVLSITVELLWNVLTLEGAVAAEVFGSNENLQIISKCFTENLALGFMLKERELRNDLIIICSLLTTHQPNIQYFHELLPLMLDLCCGPEKGVTNPAINPKYHDTTNPEDLQMKKLGWDLIDRLCANPDFAQAILEWGFIDTVVSYINVNCEVPAVVRWSTLQLLDLQAHALRTLSSLAVMGADFFSRANGAEIVHEYIAECPDVQLRNLGVSVLAQTATTHRRRELVEAGSIPLALALLRDTGDNALRVECLNLLADVVDRTNDLQSVFLDCDGVRTVLPLMTLNPDYYTELLDTVTFASVDCIWSCVFGNESNEQVFLENNGLHSLLTVIETCQPWMRSFPLSCLADFLQNPHAVELFRSWESPKSGRTATQLLTSFWDMKLPNALLTADDNGENAKVFNGLSSIGTETESTLRPRPDQPTEEVFKQEITVQRVGLQKVPADIQFLVKRNIIHFKLHVAMSLVGFDDHKELDNLERGTLVAIERFVDLCKDEIWSSVADSLEKDGVRPTTPDAEKLRLLRLAAESRTEQLLQSHKQHTDRHAQRQADAELTFYKSLIKKTEEKRVGPRKVVGLSITEAKIRKAQMLKQSFKSALARQEARDGPTDEEIAAEALRQQQEEEEAQNDNSSLEPQQRLERWGPGQRAMSDTEYGILQALNNVRTNPLSLIPLLEDKLKFLNEAGNAFHMPNRDPETCIEGAAAYHEAIDFIKTVRPLVTLLDVPMGMLYSARDHIADLSRRMDVSHDGSDGSTPQVRLQRYGAPGPKYAQMLALATSDPVEMLMGLIVNDGVKSRIDRKTIFDPDMRVCGIGMGPHSIHEVVCVFVVAQEYTEKPFGEQAAIHAKYTTGTRQPPQQPGLSATLEPV